METLKRKLYWLCDMDGVLIHGGQMVEGADQFLDRLRTIGSRFLVITNNSLYTPGDLVGQLGRMGLEVAESQIWTSALATARFVESQRPGGTAFVIGEASMHEALEQVGYREDKVAPDYVVLGETQDYSFDDFSTAIGLIERGSRFVATNPEVTGPGPTGSLPGCGAMAQLVQSATGVRPYFVGKPNPVMIREGMNLLGADAGVTVIIGDRLETDILSGVEAGLETILVLSGVARLDQIEKLPYRPSRVVASVAEIIDEL
ncbi:MAG TPA: HAD-IIA family hydrolase [Acidimicrobiales bacterium]|nr:HAD-IIA family hydrolase [Acidimicrobiales bacterium]